MGIFDMYGPGTTNIGGRRTSIAKSPLQSQVEISQVELAPTPPVPSYAGTTTTTFVNAPGHGLGLTQTPIRPRASPRPSYMRSSVATTATSQTEMSVPPLPTLPFKGISHFSATTADPATPRRFIS